MIFELRIFDYLIVIDDISSSSLIIPSRSPLVIPLPHAQRNLSNEKKYKAKWKEMDIVIKFNPMCNLDITSWTMLFLD